MAEKKTDPHQRKKTGLFRIWLWNPLAAALWSLLFTPIFGASLHMLNWRAIGDKNKARRSFWWILAGALILLGNQAACTLFHSVQARVLETCTISLLLFYFCGWFFLEARMQIQYTKKKFSGAYNKKPWRFVLLLAVGAVAGYELLGLFFTWLAQMCFPGGNSPN